MIQLPEKHHARWTCRKVKLNFKKSIKIVRLNQSRRAKALLENTMIFQKTCKKIEGKPCL